MRKKLILIFLLYAIIGNTLLLALTNEDIGNASKGVTMIITYNDKGETIGQGSGFFIDSNGTLVTNLHVLQDAESGIVKLNTGAFFEISEFLGYDSDMDIAVLKVAGKDAPFLKLGDSSMLEKGDKILALGNPMGLESTASEGMVSAIRYFEDNTYRVLQITAPISPGSSGDPILNTNGEVVGITTFLMEGQNLIK